MANARVRICFVCSGNICRSPTAEVVLRARLAERGSAGVDVDSAGTGDWHVGGEMDRRSRATLVAAGYEPAGHSAKQFEVSHFGERDLVVALDSGHLAELHDLADGFADPAAAHARIIRLRELDPRLAPGESPDVADPYYGGGAGFTDVLAQIQRSCDVLLTAVDEALAVGEPLSDVVARIALSDA